MAESPSHKFGQIIGEILEAATQPLLQKVAKEHGLYLDHKHGRASRGGKSKVSWQDNQGNYHDLDYVLEAGGSEEKQGTPKAFIEVAWRRYTKHSRNKAQEIHGAVIPLLEKYGDYRPFIGVVLAGVFTEGSLAQLRSHGFKVLYIPYASMVAAFASVKIDASFDEDTTDAALQKKVDAYGRLKPAEKNKIAGTLQELHREDLKSFSVSLDESLNRRIEVIFVLPLHGTGRELKSVKEALDFIQKYKGISDTQSVVRYEINVRYSNGDEVRATFADKTDAIKFLQAQEKES